MKTKVAIIIPCFNEEDSIENVLIELKEFCPNYDYIIINDCSTDNTSEIARKSGLAEVIDLSVNLGIGGAVQTGLRYAMKNKYDYALKYDADGQHRANEVDLILKPIIAKNADVVIGSRFLYTGNDGFKSSFIRRIVMPPFSWTGSISV